MLKNIFFTLVFFILDHFLILFVLSLISLMATKYFYKIWIDKLRAPDMRYLSLSISLLLAILLLIFIAGVLYIIMIIILFFPELRKVMGK
jgi:hypothetical protein